MVADDFRTGQALPLRPEARVWLTKLLRVDGNSWVITGKRRVSTPTLIQHPWCRIRRGAELEDGRIHDLPHIFASRALALGEGLLIIGRFLGYRRIETTARYAHLARESVREFDERIPVNIADDIL